MPLRKITAIAFAGIVTIGVGAGVIAQDVSAEIATMTPEQMVERRQEIMRENGGILRNLGTMAAADAAAAADTMIQNFTDLPALFAEGTIVGDSRALPLIWEEKEAFDAIFADAREHATAIKAAAGAGDTAAIAAEAQELGGYCGQCHDKYRAPQS
jgi:cytochrome c556